MEDGELFQGMDTFRGTGLDSSMLRTGLYQKNEGDYNVERSTLTRTDSPISGNMLISLMRTDHKIRDPIAGATLKYTGDRAVVTTPVQKQQQHHSKQFWLTKDVDITIQTLRNTTKVSRYTNEKVCTAGTPTGMDKSLKSFTG